MIKSIRFAIAALSLCISVIVHAQGLPAGKPAEQGFSSERLSRIDTVLNYYVKQGKIPGAVALVARHGKTVYYKAFGKADIEASKAMDAGSMFRIASMTKAITSAAVMTLYEQGYFLLNDPISKYIPEFKNPMVVTRSPKSDSVILVPAKSEITIRELLNHTSGITYGDGLQAPYYTKAGMTVGLLPTPGTLEEKIQALGKLPLISQPGEEFHYGMSVDVLGYLVEVITHKTLDEYLKQAIFTPLNMHDTYFSVPKEKFPRMASLYKMNKSGKLEKETKYFPYPAIQNYFAGGAGLVSTAADYSRFAQMLLNRGQLDGRRILSPKTIDLMTSNSIGGLLIFTPTSTHNGIMGDKFGLGFGLRIKDSQFNELESIGQFGWDGAFYTRFWVDPKEQVVGVFLCQMDSYWDENLIGKFRVLVNQAIVK
ncbi:beta-lactamase family protein [Mucilaginibacter mali]|uniref:Beta-lactamase family protein n=1 Tax=Mucilaginibacter mali TaxID=2740462 RepID=A0A7D4TND2_9SPHI|nr:serine hydrolase domain-containing protein [Mucilaginibacter mali]QKJ29754.1 beta-lactamase family protein [Mucilaginibacter mali]